MATNIETNIKQLQKEMTIFEKSQLPYAMSLALNNCLPFIKEDVTKHIEENISNIRSNWLKSPKGVLYTKSTKNNLTADIYSTADWLKTLNKGGSVSGSFAVATKDKYSGKELDRVGNRLSGRIRAEMRPNALRSTSYYGSRSAAKKGIKTKKGANADKRGNAVYKIWIKGKEFLVRHKVYKRRKDKLEFLYTLTKRKTYKKQINFEEAVVDSLSKHFDTEFSKAFDVAIMTAAK